MNKRKPDDEFAAINLSYFQANGSEITVFCRESKEAPATQNPRREALSVPVETKVVDQPLPSPPVQQVQEEEREEAAVSLQERRVNVLYGDTGHGYESLFGAYLKGAKEIVLEDPYIRQKYQVTNFVRFCEVVAKTGDAKKIKLITYYDNDYQKRENIDFFIQLQDSLQDYGIQFEVDYDSRLHDREIKLSNGWNIKLGKGLDYFQSLDKQYFTIGANDLDLRPCVKTSFDFYRSE